LSSEQGNVFKGDQYLQAALQRCNFICKESDDCRAICRCLARVWSRLSLVAEAETKHPRIPSISIVNKCLISGAIMMFHYPKKAE